MKSSSSLFDLIKSLSPSEKRYFKNFTVIHSRKNDSVYLKLFDAIEDQVIYDEAQVKNKFKGERFVKQLTFTKYYLYNLILKSLRNYHSENSINAQVSDLLRNIEILFDKGLYKQCAKMIHKCKGIIDEYEMLEDLVKLIYWELKLAHLNRDYGRSRELFSEGDRAMGEISNMYSNDDCLLEGLNLMDRLAFIRSDQIGEAVEEFGAKLLSLGKNVKGFRAGERYYFSLSLYHRMRHEHKESFECMKKHLGLYDEYSGMIRENMKGYLISILNLLNTAIMIRDRKSFGYYIDKLENLYVDVKDDKWKSRIFVHLFSLKLHYSISFGEIEYGLKIMDESLSDFEKSKEAVELFYLDSVYFNMTIIFLLYGDLKQALKFINPLINRSLSDSVRQDIPGFARMVNLLIHFEIGNLDVLPYFFRSTYRFLYKKRKIYEFESIFLAFLRKAIHAKDKSEMLELFSGVLPDLKRLAKDPQERIVFDEYFDFASWTEAKVSALDPGVKTKSFLEVFQGKF